MTALLVFLVVFYVVVGALTYALARSSHVEPAPATRPVAIATAILWPGLVVVGIVLGIKARAARR